jgi:hypothetical protein
MKITVGRIIKLKDYSDYANHNEKYAMVTKTQRENVSEIKWILDNYVDEVKNDNIKILKWHTISAIYDKLKEGDIVLTNGNAEHTNKDWILGKIGEITRRNKFYLWNNQVDGGRGKKKIEEGYEFSWAIYEDYTGKIIIVEKEKIPTICYKCGETFVEDKLTKCMDRRYYCEDCMNEEFTNCTYCGEQIFINDGICDKHGKMFCSNCYDKNYVVCEVCGEELEKQYAYVAEECYFCGDCYNERFRTCADCGSSYRLDDLIFDEELDEYLCGHCYRKRRRNIIHDYHYNPEFKFRKLKWEEALYMGVELEVQRETEYDIYAEKFIKFLKEEGKDKYFYLKNDGTLKTDNNEEYQGFEIVTQPFTLQYAHKNIGFQKILKWLKENQFDYGDETQKCGLHIHMSRDFFEELDITKLRIFFSKNQNQIFKFSQRKTKNNEYCQYEKIDIIKIAKGIAQENGRHWAINTITDKQTVEIRVFNSTLDSNRFVAILHIL